MTYATGAELSLIFATLVGAAGFVLAILAWLKFRGSPFGRILAILPAFMAIVAIYHPIMLLFPEYTEYALIAEGFGFVLVVIFVLLMVNLHRNMAPRGEA